MAASPECHFHLEVVAPDGLAHLAAWIQEACPDLYVYQSGWNGKAILKNRRSSRIVMGMDSSSHERLVGSGQIKADFATARALLTSLHAVLVRADLPHEIGIDNETGENTVWLSH